MQACTIRVAGTVQGVFFRASAKAMADQLGVRGLVRNEPDGSVLIEAEGDASAVEKLVAWCRKGPPRARVDSVTVNALKPRGYETFLVDRW